MSPTKCWKYGQLTCERISLLGKSSSNGSGGRVIRPSLRTAGGDVLGHKTHLIVIVDSRLKSLPDLGHELSLGLAPCVG